MKVLLGIATYPTEPHIFPATKAAIDALRMDFDGELAIDYFDRDDPKLSPRENLVNKHNQMRERVLNLEYDALFTVEADMIVPPDALTKLLEVEADIAYGLYCARGNGMWLCFPEIVGSKARALNANPDQARALWGKVVKSDGAGFGCTLIHRRVLERIEFRGDKRLKFADDWPFALDCKEAGFRSAHHLGVVCGHIIHEGGVLWPDPDAPQLYRIDGKMTPQREGVTLPARAIYRARRWLSGPSGDFAPGSEIELKAEDAAVLLERGAIEIIEEN